MGAKLDQKEKIFRAFIKVFKKTGTVSYSALQDEGFERSKVRYYWNSLLELDELARKKFPHLFKKIDGSLHQQRLKNQVEERRNLAIAKYLDLHRKHGHVALVEIADAGFNKAFIDRMFGSLTKLAKAAREKSPNEFFDVSVKSIITPARIKRLKKISSEKKSFVITAVGLGCKVRESALLALKNYCRRRDAEILVQLCADPASIDEDSRIDKMLAEDAAIHIVSQEVRLNKNFVISNLKLSTKQMLPLSGLDRLCHMLDASLVAGSPKQCWQTVATSPGRIPHALLTPGSLTEPQYSPKLRARWGKSPEGATYFSQATAYKAELDHVMGALLVDIRSEKIFHPRHVQFAEDGSFIDGGIRYLPDGEIEKVRAKGLVAGDLHCGQTDPDAKRGLCSMLRDLDPEYMFAHDLADHYSISSWEWDKAVTRYRRSVDGMLTLAAEHKIVADELKSYLAEFTGKIMVVPSNHDEWLNRWIEDKRFASDDRNFKLGCELAQALANGENPLKHSVEKYMDFADKKRVVWLDRKEEFKIDKIQCNFHGDKCTKGGRGSPVKMERCLGYVSHGHGHTPSKLRGATQVGTNRIIDVEFRAGEANDEMAANEVIYADGSRQLYPVLDGFWRLD